VATHVVLLRRGRVARQESRDFSETELRALYQEATT
jgi:hypothetical protein